MNAILEPLRQHWNRLRPRERLWLAVAAVVVLATLFYLLLWEPLHQRHQRLQAQVQEQRALLAWMEARAQEVEALRGRRGGGRLRPGDSLLGVIDRTARGADLKGRVSRIEPDGEHRVRVWLDGVAFDALARWLLRLRQDYGLAVSSAVIDREGPGRVSARLVIEEGRRAS